MSGSRGQDVDDVNDYPVDREWEVENPIRVFVLDARHVPNQYRYRQEKDRPNLIYSWEAKW